MGKSEFGKVYVGMFENGKYHGKGTLIDKSKGIKYSRN